MIRALVLMLFASPALAAPQIEGISIKPSPAAFSDGKAPEVEIAVSVTRPRFGSTNCDVRVDFGDGEGRNLDFGVAEKRTVRHVYRKGGDFLVVAKGVGKAPCEGTKQAAVTIKGPPEKKAPEKKKAEKKKADKKSASKKKEEPK